MFAWNTALFRRMSPREDHENIKDVSITVSNPRTHLLSGNPIYTDYLITIRTCNMAFSIHNSRVRRRFSEFVWLRGVLAKNAMTMKPPELPRKQVFGRFQRNFVLERQKQLQEFITALIKENTFLSDTTLHLFLQSHLSVNEIATYISGGDRRTITSIIVESYHRKPSIYVEPTVGEESSRKITPPGNYPYSSSGYESGMCSSFGKKDLPQITACGCGSGWSTGVDAEWESPLCGSLKEEQYDLDEDQPDGAMVLPSGRMLLSYKEGGKEENKHIILEDSQPPCQCPHVIQYDADDEDKGYDILNSAKKLKSRKYLDSISTKSTADESSSESSNEFSDFENNEKLLTIDVINTEYDVIESDVNVEALLIHHNYHGHKSKDNSDSDFSAVHSSIDEPVEQTPVVSGKYKDYDVIDMVNIRTCESKVQ